MAIPTFLHLLFRWKRNIFVSDFTCKKLQESFTICCLLNISFLSSSCAKFIAELCAEFEKRVLDSAGHPVYLKYNITLARRTMFNLVRATFACAVVGRAGISFFNYRRRNGATPNCDCALIFRARYSRNARNYLPVGTYMHVSRAREMEGSRVSLRRGIRTRVAASTKKSFDFHAMC